MSERTELLRRVADTWKSLGYEAHEQATRETADAIDSLTAERDRLAAAVERVRDFALRRRGDDREALVYVSEVLAALEGSEDS